MASRRTDATDSVSEGTKDTIRSDERMEGIS
jgi:hypothetical protein